MRIILILLTLSLFSCFAFGQHKKLKPPLPPLGPPTKAELEREILHEQCLHTNRYSAKQRQAFFPFSIAQSIKLISFEAPGPNAAIYDNNGKLISGDAPDVDTVNLITAMAPNSYAINYRKVKEQKVIGFKAINQLTDILYNYGKTPVVNLSSLEIVDNGTKCYEPRNAILFLDASGNATQFIELCFSCQKYYYSSSKTAPVEYCTQKFDLLRRFFRAQNIKYGTAKHFEN